MTRHVQDPLTQIATLNLYQYEVPAATNEGLNLSGDVEMNFKPLHCDTDYIDLNNVLFLSCLLSCFLGEIIFTKGDFCTWWFRRI